MPTNALLNAIPPGERSRLARIGTVVEMSEQEVLYQLGRPLRFVFFPYSGVISLNTAANEELPVEVATVGREGVVGLPAMVGAPSMPMQAFAHVPGEALRIPARQFRQAARRGQHLTELLDRYMHALFNEVAQSVACTAHHTVDQRCARSLLMLHDRAAMDEFPMTQAALSQTLGVRRALVNQAAGRLREEGAIDYRHGWVRITDRATLEKATCTCYGLIRREYRRLVGRAR